jgi:membrane protease YdiL (CAAX protease family)
MTRRAWVIALLTVVTLTIAAYAHEILSYLSAYRELHSHHPFYIAESIDKVGGATICFLAVWLIHRIGLRAISHELGLSPPLLPAVGFALLVSSPMLIGFAITRTFTPHIEVLPLLFLTVLSPLVEEIEFRGFGVRQLQRGTGWPFWVAVWPSALLFGFGHIEQGQSWQEMAGLFMLTGVGGVMFAWLVYRWENLWVPVALHICMNLWWELFSVAKTAIGGWFPFALQTLTVVLAILVTLYWTRSRVVSVAQST